MPDQNRTVTQPVRGATPTAAVETQVQRPGAAPLGVTPRPAALLATGPQTIGEYEARKKLGEGGMGVVYLGWDTQLRRNVAIKVLLPKYSAEREARERFLREARAAASVTHDNVVTIYHVGDHHGSAYLVMPLLKGQSLETYLQRKGTPTVQQTLRIARETAAGLAAAHKQGLIHRDVKPANIWLEAPNGRVKILDFGIAKAAGGGQHTAVTEDGVVMGTPAFMSPEQARGNPLDGRSDLFSLGALLYRMCAGEPPFVRDSVMDTLTALVSEDPKPVETLAPTIPPRLAALIHRLLRRDPAARPATGEEVIKELRQIEKDLAGEPGASGVLGASAAVRMSAAALPVVTPVEDFGFEVVDDEPTEVVVRDRLHTTRPRKKRAKGSPATSIVLGLTALVVGIAVAAFVILQIVRTVNANKTKEKEKAVPVANPVPAAVPPAANPAAAAVPAVKEVQPEEKSPPEDDRDRPPPPRFDPEGRPLPPPRFDPEGRPLPPPPPGGGFPPPPPPRRGPPPGGP